MGVGGVCRFMHKLFSYDVTQLDTGWSKSGETSTNCLGTVPRLEVLERWICPAAQHLDLGVLKLGKRFT